MTTRILPSLSSDLQQLQEKYWQTCCEQHPQQIATLSSKQQQELKLAVALSDFIQRSFLQAPELVAVLFTGGSIYDEQTPDYPALVAAELGACDSEEMLHRLLRQIRLQQMVKIAFADLVLDIPLTSSLKRLSALADALILGALNWLTDFCRHKWGTPQNSRGQDLPLLVFGMGKLGGEELNFSSDIDLIFAYPESGQTAGTGRSIDNQQFFTRLGQKLISALHQQTADGFVYRVDMRLRPFGESGPLVMTFDAMEHYYQEQGRDWERYAMLKARLIGCSDYHDALTALLRPFVYRRYIDFSVFDSLRRMKMMIVQEVRRKNLVNNIKLGAGGIREVEFIVQVFQLIRGGRDKELQQRRLLVVLPELVKAGVIKAASKKVLEDAYLFLRRLENIIQALDDKQTQTLPDSSLEQERVLAVLKLGSWRELLDALQRHMEAVHLEFDELIGKETPNHQAIDEHWVTLWDSHWDDEEAVTWINQLAPDWPAQELWQTLAHFRRDVARRSLGNRGRQVLDKLVPLLLCHLERLHCEDYTLSRVLQVFDKIMTRTAYLELLYENEGAFKHLIRLCSASLWVTEYIAKYPLLLDELIDPESLHNPLPLSDYALELREVMLRIPEEDLEAQMEMLRQFKQAQQLRIAAADIVGVLPLTKVSDHLTALAEAIIGEVINLAWQQVSVRFGVPESSLANGEKGFAVIGYGKAGGIELGYGSDLDLVFIHNSRADEQTTGERQVPANQFYMKLAQRIMHIFNSRMSSGILYELDMRLRPSGNSGVLVVHIDTFEHYLKNDAWIWEHQALVRARAVYGHDAIRRQFDGIKRQVLAVTRSDKQLSGEVISMRNKMRNHLDKSGADKIDIKQAPGGLVDIEFLAQYLVLLFSHDYPQIADYSDNIRIFEQLHKAGILDQSQSQLLIKTYCRLRDLGHRAVLQKESQLIGKQEFDIYAPGIIKLWQRFLVG
ncbi:bifunctional [glutamate--ammonia ligase]-adenylyl-L-tyrosine phosphorylase/[glutamate--ammonia-ligase] adenylyltransferase [Thalassomonas haliotis]|uniref:bifunctional [glutamate--ammonia ligase]-adenylyl-L-tyrosine phosphorylase/[glutamate--ammonia-ligase] adenylyltransferase n=1 Tax=Thalassomonas haliotis TaxID=485448 RepID=UPI00235FBE7E|nr:bifunctional [glutamate--ammonia ligase]-adenylyl-L-tyrosine phosphorylase/[glutamate--ammonia-ligase] adenylyltransferase [Thalassomonas haliotis]